VTVHVTSANSTISSAIPGAIVTWEQVIFGQNNFPDFVSGGTGTYTVTVSFDPATPTGTWYCGDTQGGNQATIVVHRGATQTTCNGNYTNSSQSLSLLLAHELSHAIGYKHLSDATHRYPILDHCVSSLPPSHGLNGGNCQAEIELAMYMYGARSTDPDLTKHFVTGFEVSGRAQAQAGLSSTLTVASLDFDRAQPGFVPPAASSLTYAWTSDNTAIANPSPGASAGNAIRGVAFGSTTIRVAHTSAAYEQATTVGGSAISFNVIAPPPPPTALTASAITPSSATIGWTNGATAGVTTTLQYRKNGTTTWTTASSTIAGGTSSYALGNLTASTKYDVQVWHVRDSLSSTVTTANGLFTTSPPTPLSNFRVTSCVARQEGLKTYNYFTMSWSATTIAGSSFEIGMYHTSDATQAAVIVTAAGTARSAEVGGYTAGTLLSQRWFWIRVNTGVPGPWVALADNPLATNSCAFN
jgi:hypothetical protein